MAGVRRKEWRIVRDKHKLNRVCPVCDKELRPITECYGDEIRLASNWFFINKPLGIEFVVHPPCKVKITSSNIYECLQKLNMITKTLQDLLLSIGLEDL